MHSSPLRHTLFRAAFALVVVCWLVQSSCAGTVFVDNRSGSDRNNGRSPHPQGSSIGPVRTLQAALRRALPTDEVVCLKTDHPYKDTFVISGLLKLGSEAKPFVIDGNGVELVGTTRVDPYTWEHVKGGVYRLQRPFQPSSILESFREPIPRHPTALWGPMPKLKEETYAFWQGHLYFRPANGKYPSDYELGAGTRLAGILVDKASHIVIRNFRIHGFRMDAIQVRGPVSGVRIEQCEFARNGRCGLSVYTSARVVASDCHIENNVKAGVLADNFARVSLDDCSIVDNGVPILANATATVERHGEVARPLLQTPRRPRELWRDSDSPTEEEEPIIDEVVREPAS